MQTRGKRVVAAVVIEDLIKLGIKSAQHKKSTERKKRWVFFRIEKNLFLNARFLRLGQHLQQCARPKEQGKCTFPLEPTRDNQEQHLPLVSRAGSPPPLVCYRIYQNVQNAFW